MANVSQLQPALPPQVQTSSSEASEKDTDFLALRLLNRRARLRLSPAPLDLTSFPGKASLFVTANSKGWFAAVTRDAGGASALILSPLADLRSALAAASAEDEQSYRPHRRVPIDGATPHILTFACNDTRLLLGLVVGSIHVYASDQLLSSGEGPVQPIHVLTTTSSAPLLSIQPNPGDIPDLVAVLRDCTNSPGSLAVELFDVQKHISSGGWMAGKSPSTTPTSISWSPKGKQLALGLQSGDIVTFSPTATATPKYSIPHPPSANNMSAISVHWLSTSSFHTIYAPSGQLAPDAEQIHFHVSLDSKSNSAQDIRFNNPYLPFPGLRPPGEFLLCLRGWDPSKVLLFIGDSTSSDIGLVGSVADDSGEHWHNLALEETSTPSLPLDKDQNDTVLLGMDVDLTSSESYHHSTASGEALELPAHPVMYVYASDGMVLGWHVLNVTGAPYPGMITGLNASTPALIVPSVPSSIVRELSSDMQTTPAISPTTPAPAETSAIKPPSTVFGQPSTFGAQGSVFGQPSVFGQAQSGFSQQPISAFGKAPSFGQSATIPAFGSTSTPSLFGQPSTSAFGSAAPSVGFGAFTSTGPAKFGQSSFGFGGPPQVTPTPPPPPSVPEESMAADDAPSLSGFGLGAANSEDADSKPSIFGKPSVPVSSGHQSTDSSLIRPGTGFGAFAGFDQKSPFAKPSAFSGAQQPTTMFGVSAFQGATANVFGRPAESPEPKTPLAIPSKTTGASTTPSPFTTAPALSFVARDSIARDDDSRSPSPAPVQPKVTTSSFFSSSTPGPSTGAFSNLQTTPSAFVKPASGIFGELPKDSPFFAPKPPESKPVSAFALAATPGTPASTPPKASSAQPTFGAASMPGATFKSAFPPVAAAPAQTAPASAGSAFSAFSSGGGGFAAFSSGGSKSFSDLLRSTGEDKPPRADEPKSVEVKASEASVEPKKATETVTIQEPSLESISSSTSSSFVQVLAEEECEMDSEEESEVSSSASDEEETEEHLQRESEVSSEAADEEETDEQAQREPEVSSETADQGETEQQVQRESGPMGASLPSKPAFTRSPSTTPKAEHPEITVSVSPPPQTPSPSSVPRVSPVRDLSTTPPGSPVKDTPSAPVQMPVPTLRASPPPTSPFALAPRSNNRPIRSSPLASTPIVLEGETEKLPLVSRSAPPAVVAQPAAPKPPFGQWAPLPLPPTVADSTRPKTPPVLLSPSLGEKPALSFFALPTAPASAPSFVPAGEKPAPSIFALPTAPASAPSLTPAGEKPAPSIFTPPTTSASAPSPIPAEKVVTTSIAPTAAPGPSAPLFTLPTNFASFTPSAWGSPSKFAEFTPPTTKTAQTLFGGSPSSTPPLPKTLTPAPTPTPEQGMQAECTLLLSTLNKEFENLEQLATEASLKADDLKKTSGITHQTPDLGDPRKWIFGDIEEYGRVLVGVQVDVKELKLQRMSLRKAMKELDSNILKVNTRKEEIVRFNKAKTDAEFAKMLKIRTLAPEYSETQSQLRKNIRAIRDRVQKLEDHIQASKKKINELRTGRPSIRPPSLDTVNRTFRNIDIAIDQQKQEVSQLRRRMARLENSGAVGARDQLAISSSRRPLNVTPNVAITTAAALNAERSAQRLKRAMLASRTQPLLNTTATALPVPTSFQTPQKVVVVKPDVKAPDSVFAPPTTPTMNFPPSLAGWTPPPLPSEFGSPVLHDPSPSRNRGGTKHHQKPIMLKKNTSPAGPTQQSSSPFAWQPVEPIRPVSSLPFSLRPAGSS